MAYLLVTVTVFVTSSLMFQIALGRALHAIDIDGRIGDGHEITIDQAPWMVALYITRTDGHHGFCGGSIVHERFILTAAHCFVNSTEPFEVQGIIGARNLYDEDNIWIEPTEKHCHKNFEDENNNFYNDICLLKLPTAIVFSDEIAQITLPEPGLALDTGTWLNVSGWGLTEFSNTIVENLRQVLVPLVSEETCAESYSVKSDQQFCAGSFGHDACLGDSGGPLSLGNVQVGVVSYGIGCGNPEGGVYTRVANYLNWISSTINANLQEEPFGLIETVVSESF